jgi:hypothetical protein
MVMAVNFPLALACLYAAIAATLGFGTFLIWRGQPLEIDEKVALATKAVGTLLQSERFAAGYRLLLPVTGLLRRFGISMASTDR